jgi:hypothetical protein
LNTNLATFGAFLAAFFAAIVSRRSCCVHGVGLLDLGVDGLELATASDSGLWAESSLRETLGCLDGNEWERTSGRVSETC